MGNERRKKMHTMKLKRIMRVVVLLTVARLAFASIPTAWAGDDNRAPDLQSPTFYSVQV
jgi:hypothetical protein